MRKFLLTFLLSILSVSVFAVTTNAINNNMGGLSYPLSDGSANYVLKTNGAGNLAFADVNTLLSPVTTQQVFVAPFPQGNDSTCNGSAVCPWATFAHAQAIISPTTTSKYVIWAYPGFYSENISLHANVFIAAASPVNTRLTGNIDINNSSWNTPGVDNRSGLINIEHRTGTIVFDFTTQAGNDNGKIYLSGSRFSNNVVFTGLSTNGANQYIMTNNYFFSGVLVQGGSGQIVNSYNAGGSYKVASSALPSISSDLQVTGGENDGNYVNQYTSNNASTLEIQGVGYDPSATTITTNGASATTTVLGGSLPPRGNIFTTSGGTLTVIGDSSMINANINSARASTTRSISAGTAYQPSTTHDTNVALSVTFTNVSAVSSTATFQTSPDSSTWTTWGGPIGTEAAIMSGRSLQLTGYVPASYYYRVNTSPGAGSTVTLSIASELGQ